MDMEALDESGIVAVVSSESLEYRFPFLSPSGRNGVKALTVQPSEGRRGWKAAEEHLNYVLKGHGWEGFPDRRNKACGMSYVNMGDTYSMTLLRFTNEVTESVFYRLGSWGDVIEFFPGVYDEGESGEQ